MSAISQHLRFAPRNPIRVTWWATLMYMGAIVVLLLGNIYLVLQTSHLQREIGNLQKNEQAISRTLSTLAGAETKRKVQKHASRPPAPPSQDDEQLIPLEKPAEPRPQGSSPR